MAEGSEDPREFDFDAAECPHEEMWWDCWWCLHEIEKENAENG